MARYLEEKKGERKKEVFAEAKTQSDSRRSG